MKRLYRRFLECDGDNKESNANKDTTVGGSGTDFDADYDANDEGDFYYDHQSGYITEIETENKKYRNENKKDVFDYNGDNEFQQQKAQKVKTIKRNKNRQNKYEQTQHKQIQTIVVPKHEQRNNANTNNMIAHI